MTIVDQLVARCRSLESVPPSEAVARHVFDAMILGIVGGATDEFRRTSGVLGVSDGQVQPGNFQGDPRRAGLLGAAIRLTEADDIHLASCVTPGSFIVPAALFALEEAGSVESDAFVRAVTAGYEVATALGEALDGPGLVSAGIWPSYALAPVGASVAVGIALGFDDEQLGNAIAGAFALGSVPYSIRAGSGPSMRWLGFAQAISAGIAAARAAAAGLNADRVIPDRVIAELLGGSPAGLELPTHPDGVFATVGMKPYSAGRQSLAAVQAFGELFHDNALELSSISAIEVLVPEGFTGFVNRPAPFRDRRATLGAQYQLGLVTQHPDDLYDVERLTVRDDAAMNTIAELVTISGSSELTAHYPAHWGAEVRITTDAGVLSRTVVSAKGDADDALLWPELVTKAERMLARQRVANDGLVERTRAWCQRLLSPGALAAPDSADAAN